MTLLALLLLTTLQTTVPTAGPLDSIAWEFSDGSLTSGAVDHFNVTFDQDAPLNVPLTSRGNLDTYSVKLPKLLVGSHTVTVAACNASLCGDPETLAFTFGVKPNKVVNLHLDVGK